MNRGFSHVEVVLSFVIFISFLLFLFSIFNPLPSNKEERYLEPLKRNIIENISTELNFFTLKLDFYNSGCFEFSYNEELENIKVKNKEEVLVKGVRKNNKILIGGEGDFFYIYSFKDFEEDEGLQGCKKIKEENYSIGLWRDLKVVSNKSLYDFKQNYEDGYKKIKKRLNLPDSRDFSFSIEKEEETILKVEKKTRGEVFSKTFPLQIAYKNGEIKYVIMRLKIW